jgi:hypothetical protein
LGGVGGGVCNTGIFRMFNGEISGNTAATYSGAGPNRGGIVGGGGGVFNSGTFDMYGGKISNNKADMDGESLSGGGVCNAGQFTMSGGEISSNEAYIGGGVCNIRGGTFNKSANGVVSGNKAFNGDDVYTENSSGSSGGDEDGSSGGDGSGGNGGSGSGGSDGSGSGNGGFDVWVVVVVVVSVVVVGCIFVYFKKKMALLEAKFNAVSQDKVWA